MVSNVFPGHSFYHAGRYVSKKPSAELLDYVGVRGYDYKLMAEDFIAQSELRPSKQKACFHAALSFYPGEKPTDETMTQIAREYLEGLGIVNTQYVIVKMVAFLVINSLWDLPGTVIDSMLRYLRGRSALRVPSVW